MFELSRSKQNNRRRGIITWIALGAVIGVGASWLMTPKRTIMATAEGETKKMYQCPMHPQIIQDYFGTCPICGMDLVVLEGNQSLMSPGPDGLVTVQIDTQRQQLIGLRTAAAEEMVLGGEIRAPARVVTAEPRQYQVTVKTSGYVEKLYADFVGKPIESGELLFELYSPEFITAQREYSVAVNTQKTAPDPSRWSDLINAAKRRLEYLDAPPSLIQALENGAEPARCLQIFAPSSGLITTRNIVKGSYIGTTDIVLEIADLSRVWVLADLYEQDVAQVKVGSAAVLELPALSDGSAGKKLQGHVVFIDPIVDSKTRTLKARLEFANPSGLLRPEMLGAVVFAIKERPVLSIPLDAVLDSGNRKIVFVDVTKGHFEPREIEVGRSGGGRIEVLDGLEKGEAVVTRAAFLVDSESRLQAALAELSRKIAERQEDQHSHKH
ncbi:MAG: efflux RND transporter periplasmic adaptor subunit [Holophagales bacterium]|jgi:Cu(I)/Ag(I) efflux system membrane fusion protein|nr:efflux RND transporter periplasmic adaptor subunit [Holophagales bacterium]